VFVCVSIKKTGELFPLSTTTELKGFAILAIVFSHIGYFLATDHHFLYPFSTIAGIGVDLFLFLSGFGLTISALKNRRTIKDFYTSHFSKLFTPFWIILIFFSLLDFFFLKISYPWQDIIKAFFGIFTRADIYKDFDSPLWYFTFILFYYLVFPLIFNKKYPWLSAIFLFILSYFFTTLNPHYFSGVVYFYSLHILAFPIGMIAAWFLYISSIKEKIALCFTKTKSTIHKNTQQIIRYTFMAFLVAMISYLSYHVGSNTNIYIEQIISVCAVLCIIALFIIKKIEFKILSLLGIYSYEIYLFHWPLIYRYDFLYKYIPASFATILYLILFVILGWLLQKTSQYIIKTIINAKITLKRKNNR